MIVSIILAAVVLATAAVGNWSAGITIAAVISVVGVTIFVTLYQILALYAMKHVMLYALAATAVLAWGILAEWSFWRIVVATIVVTVVLWLSSPVVSSAAAVFRHNVERDGFLRAVLPLIVALAVVPISAFAFVQLAQITGFIAPAALAVTFVSFVLYRFGGRLRHDPRRAMIVFCSIVFLPGCLYLVLSSGIDDLTRNFSLGLLELIVGYWLRFANALIVVLVILPAYTSSSNQT
jgi:hypothetical protein